MNIDNEINLKNNLINENTQKNFLETNIGKTINTAFDIGIRALLPDFVENQIIELKNNLLNYGLKEGINKTINDAIDMGKSAIGMVTGNFENVAQMQSVIKNGGLIDGMSSLVDVVVDKVRKAGLINNTVANTIKKGKNVILDNIEKNIEENFKKQYEVIEKVNKSVDNWKKYFSNQNFEEMQKEYNKIRKQINNLAPIEKTINDIKTIEILHNLIKNNGQNFNLTSEELELVEKLK